MTDFTTKELGIMFENLNEKSNERHTEVMNVLAEIGKEIRSLKEAEMINSQRVLKLEWWKAAFVWALGAGWVALPILGVLLWKLWFFETKNIFTSLIQDYQPIVQIQNHD